MPAENLVLTYISVGKLLFQKSLGNGLVYAVSICKLQDSTKNVELKPPIPLPTESVLLGSRISFCTFA